MAKLIVVSFAIVALGAFLLSVLVLGIRGLMETGQPSFTEVDGQIYIGVAGALSTIFGAVVGLKVRAGLLTMWFRDDARSVSLFKMPKPSDACAAVYAIGLVLSVLFLAVDPDKKNVADAITALALTFAGILPGALLMFANIKPLAD